MYGYSAYQGQQLWGPTTAYTNPWGSEVFTSTSAYGNYYAESIDGIHAFNLATGNPLWTFYAPSSGFQNPSFPTYPFEEGSSVTVADNKVFVFPGNSHGDALFNGASLYALDATSGQQIWSISGFFEDTMAIADGYLVAFNGYDNQIYCFGKGQTATSVTATPGVGNAVTIEGTVTDQSSGQTCLGTPAAGTPAVSDASMSAWMAYLYEQQPMPTNATGVPLTLTVYDSNGNVVATLSAQTDITGHYMVSWTPPSTGMYKVTASFDGTNSYFVSTSETGIAVGVSGSSTVTPSPQVSTAPVPPGSSGVSTMTYVAVAAAVIIIAVVAVALVLRRRKS